MDTSSNTTNCIRVLIVDDHPLFRQGLERALSLEDDMELVAQGVDGKEALELAHQYRPDVALVDVNLPDADGHQVTRQIKAELPNTAVVMLTAYHDTQQVLFAMRSGAAAYCPKSIHPEQLANVVRDVAKGWYIVDGDRMNNAQVTQWIQQNVEEMIGPYSDDPQKHLMPLSPREAEILRSVTQGLSNKEISLALGISQQTVKNHMTSILRKLNVVDRTQAAVTALRHGWVNLQDTDSSSSQ